MEMHIFGVLYTVLFVISVAYTHLDVYKRQHMEFVRRMV